MRVLIIKLSSLGDVIHTLPAVTDAARAWPGLRFDWLVEEAFVEAPGWHPAVAAVIPAALRRWRKAPLAAWRSGEWRRLRERLRATRYDQVLDAQGLIKSAWLARWAQGPRVGLDHASAREPLASWGYGTRVAAPPGRHAVVRLRTLFAGALGYQAPTGAPDYGIALPQPASPSRRVLLLHGTTWATKHYPEAFWRELARLASAAGFGVDVPWGDAAARARAQRLTRGLAGAAVLPRLSLEGIARHMMGVSGVIAVDTGLAHLAAALARPQVVVYGPTDPRLTGVCGRRQAALPAALGCAPCLRRRCSLAPAAGVWPRCFSTLPPAAVWERLLVLMADAAREDAVGLAVERAPGPDTAFGRIVR